MSAKYGDNRATSSGMEVCVLFELGFALLLWIFFVELYGFRSSVHCPCGVCVFHLYLVIELML